MLKSVGLVSALLLLNKNNQVGLTGESDQLNFVRNAICLLYPHGNSGVHGVVSFQQDNIKSPTKIAAVVRGLKANSLHGFHIHEFGDLSDGCVTAGPHYNPMKVGHGGPLDRVRHVGDLGNLRTNEQGVGYMAVENDLVQLFGEFSVVGRSVVVHEDEDDLGLGNFADSGTTGHSGSRVACGIIGLSKEFKNIQP